MFVIYNIIIIDNNFDYLLNIDNIYFDQMVARMYPTELQLNKVNSSATEAPFFKFESMYI